MLMFSGMIKIRGRLDLTFRAKESCLLSSISYTKRLTWRSLIHPKRIIEKVTNFGGFLSQLLIATMKNLACSLSNSITFEQYSKLRWTQPIWLDFEIWNFRISNSSATFHNYCSALDVFVENYYWYFNRNFIFVTVDNFLPTKRKQ